MKPKELAKAKQRQRVIIEVEGYDGDSGSIVVINRRAHEESLGASDRLYCIGEIDDDGVVRFLDWGYATAQEALEAARPSSVATRS